MLYLLLLAWTAFFTLHSILADLRIKKWLKNFYGKYYPFYRLFYNIFSIIAFLGLMFFQWQLPSVWFWEFSFWNYTGVLLMLLGIAVAVIGFKHYDTEEFLGLRQLQGGQSPEHEKLQQSGLHRFVRHPLYFGTILLLLGYFIWQPTEVNLVFVGVSLLYLPIGTYLEERKLRILFGDEYKEYQQKVKMLIPFIF